MKNILLLGSTGMLGQYIKKYFKQQNIFNIIPFSRNELDVENTSKEELQNIIKDNEIDYIINCVGMIKPQIKKYSMASAIKVNSLFPFLLDDAVKNTKTTLIHITTDCVYSGCLEKGKSYNEKYLHDVEDDYGLTKFLGEPQDSMVIRTSIIGEEVNQQRSLIEWFKSCKDGKANGFTNHYWNGVTCLQLSKIIHQLIHDNQLWVGKRHIYSDIVDKFELLTLINNAFNLNVDISKVEGSQYCNRSLSSIYENVNKLTLKQQLDELKKFSEYLYNEGN